MRRRTVPTLVSAVVVLAVIAVVALRGDDDEDPSPTLAPSAGAEPQPRPSPKPNPTRALPKHRPAFQAHAMIYSCCMSITVKRKLFAAVKASGATKARVDFAYNGIVRQAPGASTVTYDWAKTDETLTLAREQSLQVVGVLTGTSDHLAKCPAGTPVAKRPSCPPADPRVYARHAGEIVAHTRGRVAAWELFNEPDLRPNFRGSPEQYGRLLDAFYREAKAASPSTPVLNGGIASVTHAPWIRRAVAAGARFDIASGHLRQLASRVRATTVAYRKAFEAATGRRMPFWVTELGYSSVAADQTDPAYRGGEAAQAAYLRAALPAARRGGAANVFVTLRDGPEFGDESPYRWEGLVYYDGTTTRARPALATVARLNLDLGRHRP